MKAGRPRKQRPWRPGAPAPIQAAGCGPERRLAVRQPNRPGSRLRLKHTPTGHAQDWLEIQHRRKKKGSAATVINDIQYLAGKQFQHLACRCKPPIERRKPACRRAALRRGRHRRQGSDIRPAYPTLST